MAALDATRPTALLFPGQGSQTAGMRDVVAAHRPDLLETAERRLGVDPFAGLERSTALAQPAIYCASLAFWERSGRPAGDLIAGHSLGELAALAAAGALRDEDGLRLAIVRGRLMEEEAAKSPGGMLAVMGDAARDATTVASRFGLAVANENAPGQVVLSGHVEAIEQARRVLRVEGQRAIALPVAGAFHSAAMAAAEQRLRKLLARVRFEPPRVPVYSSIAAAPFADPREALAGALTRPVRWQLTLERMREAGAERFLEVGPGSVLTGLVRRTFGDAEATSLAEMEPANA